MSRESYNLVTGEWESPVETPREMVERLEREADEARVLREADVERERVLTTPSGLYL